MDIIKYDMTDIWAVAGDVVAPDSAKVRAGWGVEVVPRQWWNWFENRQDNNIAYMLQKGFPEWDATTQYIINKSYVQRNGIVYRATATSTNSDPVALSSWVKAFPDSTPSLEALGTVTPVANTLPYYTSASAAATTALSAFGRSIVALVDASAARTLFSAQLASANLTALSGVTPDVNVLPYFTSTTVMSGTTLTAFARTMLDDVDAPAMRTTLGVYSTTESDAALTAGLAGKQPLDATLTGLAGLATGVNQLAYSTGTDTFAQTTLAPFARTFLDDADAPTVRTTLSAAKSGANTDITSLSSVTLNSVTTLAGALNEVVVTLASAATVNIGAAAGNIILVSGTTTITAFDTAPAGTRRKVYFSGSLTLTHNSSVINLPTAANIVTQTGDSAEMLSNGGGSWICLDYARFSGQPLGVVSVAQGGTGVTSSTGTGNVVLSASPTLTGVPLVPTAAPGTNNTQAASTAYVLNAISSGAALQPGLMDWFATMTPPAGYLAANSSAVSRTTYAALLASITASVAGTATAGSPTLASVATTSAMWPGMPFSHANWANGTTVVSVTVNSITLSTNAIGSGAVVGALIMPFGVGDNSTTFNVPDGRGVVPRGWDNGRGLDPSRLFGSYQADQNLSHTHGVSDPGHAHGTPVALGTAFTAGGVYGPISGGGGTYGATTGITIQASGGTEGRVKNIALLACIKY